MKKDATEKKEIKVELFTLDDCSFFGYGPNNNNRMSLDAFVTKIKAKVKEKCKVKGIKSIRTELRFSEVYGDYEDSVVVTVHAIRLETDEEVAKRIERSEKARIAATKRNKDLKKKKDERDRKEYERLKKKFANV